MSEISVDELEEFCELLKAFREQLPKSSQKNLLDTILKIARETAAPLDPPTEGFGCFEPNQAALILKYHQGDAIIKPSILHADIIRPIIRPEP